MPSDQSEPFSFGVFSATRAMAAARVGRSPGATDAVINGKAAYNVMGDWAVAQLWAFWVAPIVGALLGASAYKLIGSKD